MNFKVRFSVLREKHGNDLYGARDSARQLPKVYICRHTEAHYAGTTAHRSSNDMSF